MSRVLAFVLVVSVALTAQAFALARGQAAAAGEMVICAGGTLLTITVDAEGNPTGPGHVCPDAVLALAFAVAAPDLPVAGAEFSRMEWTARHPVPAGGRVGRAAQARGPPAQV